MRTLNLSDLRAAVEAVPDEEKLAVLKGYFLLVDILNTPLPGTEPTITNGVDLTRLNEAVGEMSPGEHKIAEITKAYGGNPKSKDDRKKIMEEIKVGRVTRLHWQKPVRGVLMLSNNA